VNIAVDSVDMSVNFTPDMQLRAKCSTTTSATTSPTISVIAGISEPGAELLVVAGDDATFPGRTTSPTCRGCRSAGENVPDLVELWPPLAT